LIDCQLKLLFNLLFLKEFNLLFLINVSQYKYKSF